MSYQLPFSLSIHFVSVWVMCVYVCVSVVVFFVAIVFVCFFFFFFGK